MKQDIYRAATTGPNLWTTATNWSQQVLPGANDDAYIDKPSVIADTQFGSTTAPGYTATVNSIGTAQGSLLFLTGQSTLVAKNGTELSHSDTSSAGSGNRGTIIVDQSSALSIDGSFKNAGTLEAGTANTGIVYVQKSVNLSGGGNVTLGAAGIQNGYGYIFGAANASLTNADNRITGGQGGLYLSNFDNQEKGVVDVIKQTSGAPAFVMSISDKFKNEGTISVEAGAKLHLGNFGTQSLVNSGNVNLGILAELEIQGNYTVSGHGAINMSGTGSDIISDGFNNATLNNKSNIIATANGQIGDKNISSANHLTLDNSGLIDVTGDRNVLTLNTGSNVIDNTGTLKAEKGGILLIQSDVSNSGIIEADKGSGVVIGGSVTGGATSHDASGKIVIDGGLAVFGLGSSADVPVTFTKNGGTLSLENSTNVNVSGSKGEIDLSSQSKVSVNGNNDSFKCGVDNTISVNGNHESFAFGPANGRSTVSGWNSTDSMQLARSDFANWGSLLQHTQQVGADTVISTGANESITLKGVAVSSLNQSQFHFA